jgi:transmembrane sensor
MRDDIDWVLLGDYFSNRATPAQRAAVERWMADDPARRRRIEALHLIWLRSGEVARPVGPVDARAAWRALQPRLERRRAIAMLPGAHPASLDDDMPMHRRVLRSAWLRAAAVVLVAAGGAFMARVPLAEWLLGEPGAVPPTHQITTARGQRAELRLGDGTRVVLGAQSTLRWSVRPGARARDVYLEGEALFEVTHDARHPFRVHAGHVIAEDLGTVFAVHAYPSEPRVTVAVKEGKVELSASRVPAARDVLHGGDLGVVIADSAVHVTRGADVDQYLAFTRGQLVFAEAPMREVVPELERWYDIQLTLVDSTMADVVVTAGFEQDDLDTALRFLATSLDAHVERRGRAVTFRPN